MIKMSRTIFGESDIQTKGEKAAIREATPTFHTYTNKYRPMSAVLTNFTNVLSCKEVIQRCAFKTMQGKWQLRTAKAANPAADRIYSVKLMGVAAGNTPVYLLKDGEQVSETKTDSSGSALISLPVKTATTGLWTVSLTPELPPMETPLSNAFLFTTWQVTCSVKNKSDVWWRHVGRSFNEDLPRVFYKPTHDPKFPIHFIGLGAPYGTQRFIDIVPIFEETDMTLEYGISAWCNTKNPRPTTEDCIEARKKTWWEYKIEAFNGKTRKTVTADLNIDHHLQVKLTTDEMTGRVVKPDGAQT